MSQCGLLALEPAAVDCGLTMGRLKSDNPRRLLNDMNISANLQGAFLASLQMLRANESGLSQALLLGHKPQQQSFAPKQDIEDLREELVEERRLRQELESKVSMLSQQMEALMRSLRAAQEQTSRVPMAMPTVSSGFAPGGAPGWQTMQDQFGRVFLVPAAGGAPMAMDNVAGML